MTDTLPQLISALADRYRIDRELGAGGMATVYLARDLRHDRDVALKVLRTELAESIGRQRFRRDGTQMRSRALGAASSWTRTRTSRSGR
jgi:serine/threonine protein kinase